MISLKTMAMKLEIKDKEDDDSTGRKKMDISNESSCVKITSTENGNNEIDNGHSAPDECTPEKDEIKIFDDEGDGDAPITPLMDDKLGLMENNLQQFGYDEQMELNVDSAKSEYLSTPAQSNKDPESTVYSANHGRQFNSGIIRPKVRPGVTMTANNGSLRPPYFTGSLINPGLMLNMHGVLNGNFSGLPERENGTNMDTSKGKSGFPEHDYNMRVSPLHPGVAWPNPQPVVSHCVRASFNPFLSINANLNTFGSDPRLPEMSSAANLAAQAMAAAASGLPMPTVEIPAAGFFKDQRLLPEYSNSSATTNRIDQKEAINGQRFLADNSNSGGEYDSEQQQRGQERRPHIKKPLNAFMLFMREHRSKVVNENDIKESAAINQLLGRKWHSLPKEEQSKYYEMAKEERMKHMELHPGWSARENYGLRKRRRTRREPPRNASSSNPEFARKCRARYGSDRVELWCKTCKRKKKCSRFTSEESSYRVAIDNNATEVTSCNDGPYDVVEENEEDIDVECDLFNAASPRLLEIHSDDDNSSKNPEPNQYSSNDDAQSTEQNVNPFQAEKIAKEGIFKSNQDGSPSRDTKS